MTTLFVSCNSCNGNENSTITPTDPTVVNDQPKDEVINTVPGLCLNDPLITMELAAPSDVSQEIGALWGCRRFDTTTCNMPLGDRPKRHKGLDLKADINTNVYVMYDGIVQSSTRSGFSNTVCDNDRAHGNRVVIRSAALGDTYDFFYCHLTSLSISSGQNVKRGDIVGKSGTSGNACRTPNPHLHIEIRKGNSTFNPVDFMTTKFSETGIKTDSCN